MKTSRLEAFSDGVIAIIITIMVLELRPPHGHTLESLRPLLPVFLSYVLSFIYVGIYWNNHHHMLQAAEQVTGWVLWANLHLLFWLSLFPFTTAWVGESPGQTWPTATYGLVLLAASLSYVVLENALLSPEQRDSILRQAMGARRKEWVSSAAYAVAIVLAFIEPWLATAVYIGIAATWFLPDRRIEQRLRN
jgi:TMEM175 potassium channel family protein